MRILISEDDFVNRRLLQAILAPFGTCDIVVNGLEALEAFKLSWEDNTPYDLICLDIMMPEIDGQKVLKNIRWMENELGVNASKRSKIIMTTALDDFDNIKRAFSEKCDAYLVKPIIKEKVLSILREINLIEEWDDLE